MASGAITANITKDDSFSRDEDRPIRVDVTDDGTTTGVRIDMTGWALEYKIFKRRGGVALLTKTVSAGIVLASTLADAILDRAVITTTDGDKDAGVPGATYDHYLKRTDAVDEHFIIKGTVALADIGDSA